MRIIHFISAMVGGGAERQLSVLAHELVKLGLEVHVAFTRPGANFKRLEASGAKLHHINARNNHDPIIFWKIWQIIRVIKPDVIQTWLRQMDILAGIAARLTGIPWIISEQTSAEEYPVNLKHWTRRLLAKRATAIIANSMEGLSYWEKYLDNHINKYLIRNALPIQEILSSKAIEMKKYQIDHVQTLLLFAGRFSPQKNISNLVLALSEVLENPKIGAILCGEGELRSEMEDWIREQGLANRVKLPGYLPETELWGLMKKANAFISVSLFEGQPNVVLEAMVCHCPLVVSDIPAHQEFLDKQSALLINPRDVGAIAQGIREVLEAPESARARAQVAKEKVLALTNTGIASQYEEVYREVIRQ